VTARVAWREAPDAILRAAGVNPAQYRILIALFRTLGERREVTGQLGLDARGMRLVTAGLWLPAAFISLLTFAPGSLRTYDLSVFGLTSFMLLLLVVLEGANTFLNPVEITVLAAQPIGNATVFAAKLTYLIAVTGRLVLALHTLPALAGLYKPQARWFYPLTHLSAAGVGGVLTALVACASFGILFRWLPVRRVRNAALWLQLGLTASPLLLNALVGWGRPLIRAVQPAVGRVEWSFLPIVWLNALAVAGQGDAPPLAPRAVVAGAAVTSAFVAYGVRSLSRGYLSRIVGVLRSSARRRAAGQWRPFGRIVALLSRGAAGQAAFGFLTCQMRRDWQFRRALVQGLPMLLLLPALVQAVRAGSPFVSEGSRLKLIGVLPEGLPLLTLMVTSVLAYSDQHRGAWIFVLAPRASLSVFARGVFWTIWGLFIAAPLVILAPLCAWHWGAGDALLFMAYSLAVSSWLLALQCLLIAGLPFASPPRSDRAAGMLSLVLFGPVAIGLGFALQSRFIFQSRMITIVVTAMAGLVAVATIMQTVASLDRTFDVDLGRIAAGGGGDARQRLTPGP
jgi:hypothetical protein